MQSVIKIANMQLHFIYKKIVVVVVLLHQRIAKNADINKMLLLPQKVSK